MVADETTDKLTHLDSKGNARMVDISNKDETLRVARARSEVRMSAEAYGLVFSGGIAKGDVLGVARLAGIMAAKKTPEIIPLAHPLLLTRATVDLDPDDAGKRILITATVETTGRTGVEMEALTAAAASALTVYDMCKSVDKGITIENIRLLSKSGGKSGEYQSK